MTDAPAHATSPERLAIVVVNFGSSALLRVNLGAVAAACPEALVIVVDNASTAAERRTVQQLVPDAGWIGVYPDRNLGFGTGMNRGVEAARSAGATELLLLNPDAVIGASDIRRLRDTVQADPMVMVSPLVRRPDGTIWFTGADLYLSNGRMQSRRRRVPNGGATREWLSGACLMVSTQLWDAVGGFSDDYFLYWEDVDLSQRVVEAGGRLLVLETASAVHDEGGTHRGAARSGKSATYYYWNTRNRLRYAVDHLSPGGRLRWMVLSPWAAREILLQGGRRQLLRPARPLLAVTRGTVAGCLLVLRSLVATPRRPRPSVHRSVTGTPVDAPDPAD